MIGLSKKTKNYLLFDIGGTSMRVAYFNGKRVEDFKKAPTPERFEEGMELLKDMLISVRAKRGIDAVSGGVAGVLDVDKETIYRSPNLALWNGKNIKKYLSTKFETPVFIENDSALAGLGEVRYGAGRGFGIVAYFSVSTGIGGARIVNGKIDERVFGFEPGHQIVDGSGKDLESLISGNALYKRYGKLPTDITDPIIQEEIAKNLAHGIYNTILHWSPEVVLLGGALVTKNNPIKLNLLESHLRLLPQFFPKFPKIKVASLGEQSVLYGALAEVSIGAE